MSNTIGGKVKELRKHFDMSQKQATRLIGTGISHSSWAYWESHGCPVERLVEISKMTVDAKETFSWLTSTGNGKMPKGIQLIKPIPVGSGFMEKKGGRGGKKKKSEITRRNFTPQDRANLIEEVNRVHKEIGSFDLACRQVGDLAHSVVRRWMHMDLPPANGDGVKGILPKRVPDSPEADTTSISNLPQIPVPPPGRPAGKPSTPSGRGGYRPAKVTKAKALITSQYLCPHCGSPVFLPEE